MAIGATVVARLLACGGRTALAAGLIALALEGGHRVWAGVWPG